jgi:hypothetical protein
MTTHDRFDTPTPFAMLARDKLNAALAMRPFKMSRKLAHGPIPIERTTQSHIT